MTQTLGRNLWVERANMHPALSEQPVFTDPSLLMWSMASGFLVGVAAMVFVLAAGWGMIAAISVYAAAGSFGLLGMAASALRPRTTPAPVGSRCTAKQPTDQNE